MTTNTFVTAISRIIRGFRTFSEQGKNVLNNLASTSPQTSDHAAVLKDRAVVVTGACGTIGSELVRQLLEDFNVSRLVGLDNNESDLFLLDQRYGSHSEVEFVLADVRDSKKLGRMFRDIDIVFHAAAFKHVILCERSPFEAIQTNILGVRNVIDAAYENRVRQVIFTSSDKAVNPTNVMGTTKLMGERLITAANHRDRGEAPRFASTRFGNVLGSRGSVIPLFRRQIAEGGPVTLTDPDMTRFIMSIREAVRLVIDSTSLAHGGEVFVTKMPAVRIQDLAELMIQELAPQYGHRPEDMEIQVIGAKPGEKLYEELLSGEETRRTRELERYFVVLPPFISPADVSSYRYPGLVSEHVDRTYVSATEPLLSRDKILPYLEMNGIL